MNNITKRIISFLSILVLIPFLVSCSSGQKVNISEVYRTCKDLPSSGDPRMGSETMAVILEGYLTDGTKNSSNSEVNVTVKETLDSTESTSVTFKIGSHNNEIQFADSKNFSIKTSDGGEAKPGDKLRIAGDLQSLYDICDIEVKSIEKL